MVSGTGIGMTIQNPRVLVICTVLVVIAVFAYILTGVVRAYSIKHSLIDNPNERSSHESPTPRGGGLSISICVVTSILILTCIGWLPGNYAIAMAGGGILVAVVGWMDDHRDISASWRGVLYLIAAVLALLFIGGLEQVKIGDIIIYLGFTGSVLAVVGITWLTNLYNFMDGTDALASMEAISTGAFTGILFWLNNQYGIAVICMVVATACLGFLLWNWPPAKIFMGDVGSCLIGYIFGVLAVVGEVTSTVPIYIWIILMSVFICDATFTLIYRFFKREKWYSAHRSHAYQRLTQLGISHACIAISIFILNIGILWPAAYISYKMNNISVVITALSIILMFILWLSIQYNYQRKIPDLRGKMHE